MKQAVTPTCFLVSFCVNFFFFFFFGGGGGVCLFVL